MTSLGTHYILKTEEMHLGYRDNKSIHLGEILDPITLYVFPT